MEGVVGVEDCGEKAEGERSDPERHVEARFSKTGEHLGAKRKPVGQVITFLGEMIC